MIGIGDEREQCLLGDARRLVLRRLLAQLGNEVRLEDRASVELLTVLSAMAAAFIRVAS